MNFKKWWQLLFLAPVVLAFVGAALIILAAALIYPGLPSLEALTDYRPKIPLRVYTNDGYLIGEFGEERRAFIGIADMPINMKNAVLAIEDRRFYSHSGVDTHGILRAIFNNASGKSKEGASTITMQVARNFFLSSERSLKRKVNEALLALKIEHNLSKDQILELYVNQIYLGQRSYGFAAASQTYFGKPLKDLTLAESALLAGLPKAPSSYNPFTNPKRAISRQHEVLHDMYRFGFIDESTYKQATEQKLRFKASRKVTDVSADYVAEIIRQAMYERYQDAIYSSGMRVYTTVRKVNQEAANQAVIQGILDYDQRHSYRGPEKIINLANHPSLDSELEDLEDFNGLTPAIITQISPNLVKAYMKDGEIISISDKGLDLVKKTLAEKDPHNRKLVEGARIRVLRKNDTWFISQLPQVESGLIALDPRTGEITALVGGFNFNRNKFNHVTQAWRQPGSSFKPFIYSAAIEQGFMPANLVDDEPITVVGGDGQVWSPHNYDGKYDGPIRIRTALTKSKNMVSVRLLKAIGVHYAQDYITRFGFSAKDHPAYLTMALGAGSVTAWQMAGGYAVFANGGYKIKPQIISKITDSKGKVIEQTKFSIAAQGARRVIDGRNAFLMTSMMQDVVRIGTATRAKTIGRNDLAGKTGTTNDARDAWFAGFNPTQVAVAWIGFDKPKTLGHDETGGKAALPIWVDYMTTALKNVPDKPYRVPVGVEAVKVGTYSGKPVNDDEEGYFDYFYHEYMPAMGEPLPPLEGTPEDQAMPNVDTEAPPATSTSNNLGAAPAGAPVPAAPAATPPTHQNKATTPAPQQSGGTWPPAEQLF